MRGLPCTSEQIWEIQRLRAEGVSQREIARRLGVTLSSVAYWGNTPGRLRQRGTVKEWLAQREREEA